MGNYYSNDDRVPRNIEVKEDVGYRRGFTCDTCGKMTDSIIYPVWYSKDEQDPCGVFVFCQEHELDTGEKRMLATFERLSGKVV